jgi:hypothetical protein
MNDSTAVAFCCFVLAAVIVLGCLFVKRFRRRKTQSNIVYVPIGRMDRNQPEARALREQSRK